MWLHFSMLLIHLNDKLYLVAEERGALAEGHLGNYAALQAHLTLIKHHAGH